jgi:3-methyladenine DNA glycosylase AlkC
MLKDDPERYVQRSVANNLNDIGKDHPDLAVEVCGRWSIAAKPGRAWIVKHALRSLVKKGHGGALALMGAGPQGAHRQGATLPAQRRAG